MSNTSADIKLCPFCAEEIKLAAIVCKHCSRDLPNTNGAPHQGKGQSAFESEEDSASKDESCWDCGFVQPASSGACANCGVELNSEKYLSDASPSKAASTFSVLAVVILVFGLVAGVWWFLNGLDPNRKTSTAAENYPVASTVREAAAYAVAHYCSDSATFIHDPSNWMAVGGTKTWIITSGGQITLNAALPGADGSPGEVTATDSLSREALEAWNCQQPMLVSSIGG
jgi:hypothetical protein